MWLLGQRVMSGAHGRGENSCPSRTRDRRAGSPGESLLDLTSQSCLNICKRVNLAEAKRDHERVADPNLRYDFA